MHMHEFACVVLCCCLFDCALIYLLICVRAKHEGEQCWTISDTSMRRICCRCEFWPTASAGSCRCRWCRRSKTMLWTLPSWISLRMATQAHSWHFKMDELTNPKCPSLDRGVAAHADDDELPHLMYYSINIASGFGLGGVPAFRRASAGCQENK